MKALILISIFAIVYTPLSNAQSRLLITEENSQHCQVETEEIFFTGVLAAKIEIENQDFIKLDSLTFIKSNDSETSCDFLFDLHFQKEYLGQAQIVLSKNSWLKISGEISKGNDTARW